MKLSYNWLKKYVPLKESPEKVAEALTMSGSEVGEIEKAHGDSIMELEITSNRPDCLNIIGLAREVSSVFNVDLTLPEMEITSPAEEGPKAECVIKAKDLCPRYTARVIRDVSIAEASKKIKGPISSLGLRPVNSAVDVTNFVLMETGQPLHAFDLDKIKGGKIIIREAVKGEKIVTIDGEERLLKAGMLVIADAEKPVAVAGVMGGKETEVTEKTKNILLESAYFDPLSVRRTSRELGLSSDSSYRFERGVDKAMVDKASDRASLLIASETGGKICAFYDEGKASPEEPEITFDIARAGEVLGITLERDDVERILSRLGLEITGEDGHALTVRVPSFREDLRRSIDLVEEVARMHGYHNIPARVNKLIPQIERKKLERLVIEKIRQLLYSAGLNEIMTYSLISEEDVKRFRGVSGEAVKLSNPLSEEHEYLAPQLVHGMLKAISWNLNRQNEDLKLFEIGKIYKKGKGKERFTETNVLSVGMTGLLRRNWVEGEREMNLFDLRGTTDLILRRLHLEPEFFPKDIEGFFPAATLGILGIEGELGFGGEVKRSILRDYDIDRPVYVCQIELDKILEEASLENHYRAIPRFPFSSRDVSILCDETVIAGEMYKAMLGSGEELIQAIELIDAYRGEKIPKGKVSYTYSIKYGLPTRTLRDEEIEAVHSRLKETLSKKFNVTFR